MADESAGPGSPKARIQVWARPGSSKESVKWDQWRRRWTVSVTAPAQEGRANEAILDLLAKVIGVPSSSLVLRHGQTSTSKTIEVHGIDQNTVDNRLRENLEGRLNAQPKPGP